ncbi:hypothetical protein M885DRAFT_528150 [Pelagophyceae sp. CCMP2097]|nr:hypothetical protein M885DRAFT_528150 [Pelagophyceae sp. CCMP2097]
MAAHKRQRVDAAAAAAPPTPAASSASADEAEEAALLRLLSRRAPHRKEIEGADGTTLAVDRTLPSFFDYYPRAKRAHAAVGAARERLELLRACKALLDTGDAGDMGVRVAAALGDDAAAAVVDVDAAGAGDRTLQWQCDGGDMGWLDFCPAANAAAEAARTGGREAAEFHSRGHHYRLNLAFMIQTNVASGTVRPVRFVD